MDARGRKRAGAALGIVTVAVLSAVACATTTLQGTLAIVTGPDNGFLVSPQPNLLVADFVASNGTSTTTTFAAETRLPTDGGLSLPSQPGGNVDIIQLTGLDDAGDAVVSGSTIPIALDQLSGITVNVFVQRSGQFSRLPSIEGGTAAIIDLPSHVPLLTTLYDRYLLIADGTGKSTVTQLYDTLTWSTEPLPPCLGQPALSLAFVNSYTGTDAAIEASTPVAALLQVGPGGAAGWLDITDSTGCGLDGGAASDAMVTSDAMAPDGGAFIQVAGGQTVTTPNNSYVVGPTRASGGATNGVLRISPSGVLSWTALKHPRQGAAAAYLPNAGNYSGIYVFGGIPATDGGQPDAADGVEFVSDTYGLAPGLVATPLPFDTTTGAGAVALDSNTILLAGGVTADGKPAPVRVYTVLEDAGPTNVCAGHTAPVDAGTPADAGVDAPLDAELDAHREDAHPDAGVDAHHATVDAGPDAHGGDATRDAHRADAAHDATLAQDAHNADASDPPDAHEAGSVDAASGALTSSGFPELPVTFVTAQAFAISPPSAKQGPSALVIGTTADGVTSAYRLTCSSVTQVRFKATRTNAQAIVLPNNSLAVVGGDSGTMESFIP